MHVIFHLPTKLCPDLVPYNIYDHMPAKTVLGAMDRCHPYIDHTLPKNPITLQVFTYSPGFPNPLPIYFLCLSLVNVV